MRKVKFYSEVDIFNIQEFLNIKIQTFENTPQDKNCKSIDKYVYLYYTTRLIS